MDEEFVDFADETTLSESVEGDDDQDKRGEGSSSLPPLQSQETGEEQTDSESNEFAVKHVFIPAFLMLENGTITHSRDNASVSNVVKAWKQFDLGGSTSETRENSFFNRLMETTSTVSRENETDLIKKRREDDPLVVETTREFGFDLLEVINTKEYFVDLDIDIDSELGEAGEAGGGGGGRGREAMASIKPVANSSELEPTDGKFSLSIPSYSPTKLSEYGRSIRDEMLKMKIVDKERAGEALVRFKKLISEYPKMHKEMVETVKKVLVATTQTSLAELSKADLRMFLNSLEPDIISTNTNVVRYLFSFPNQYDAYQLLQLKTDIWTFRWHVKRIKNVFNLKDEDDYMREAYEVPSDEEDVDDFMSTQNGGAAASSRHLTMLHKEGMDRPFMFRQMLGPLYTQTTNLALTVYENADPNSILGSYDLFGEDDATKPVKLWIHLPISDQVHHEVIALSSFTDDLTKQVFLAIFEEPEPSIVHFVMFLFNDDGNLEYVVQISRRASETEMREGFSKPIQYVYEPPTLAGNDAMANFETAGNDNMGAEDYGDDSDEFMSSDARFRKTTTKASARFTSTAGGPLKSDMEALRNDFEKRLTEIEERASARMLRHLDEAGMIQRDGIIALGPDYIIGSVGHEMVVNDYFKRVYSARLSYQKYLMDRFQALINSYKSARKAIENNNNRTKSESSPAALSTEGSKEMISEYTRLIRKLVKMIGDLVSINEATTSKMNHVIALGEANLDSAITNEVAGNYSPPREPPPQPYSPKITYFDEADGDGKRGNRHIHALNQLLKQWDQAEKAAEELALRELKPGQLSDNAKLELRKKWNATRQRGLEELKITHQKDVETASGDEKTDLVKCIKEINSLILNLKLRPTAVLTSPSSSLPSSNPPLGQTEGRISFPANFGSHADLKRRLSQYDQEERRDKAQAKLKLEEDYPDKGPEYDNQLEQAEKRIHQQWNKERLDDLAFLGRQYKNYLRVASAEVQAFEDQALAKSNEVGPENFGSGDKQIRPEFTEALRYRDKILDWIKTVDEAMDNVVSDQPESQSPTRTSSTSLATSSEITPQSLESTVSSSPFSDISSSSKKEKVKRRIREILYGAKAKATKFDKTNYGLSDFHKSPSVSPHFYETQATSRVAFDDTQGKNDHHRAIDRLISEYGSKLKSALDERIKKLEKDYPERGPEFEMFLSDFTNSDIMEWNTDFLNQIRQIGKTSAQEMLASSQRKLVAATNEERLNASEEYESWRKLWLEVREVIKKIQADKLWLLKTFEGKELSKTNSSSGRVFEGTQAKQQHHSTRRRQHCVTCTTVTNDPTTFMQLHANFFTSAFKRAKNYIGEKAGFRKTPVAVNSLEKLDRVARSSGMDSGSIDRLNIAAGMFKTPYENRKDDLRGFNVTLKYLTVKLADNLRKHKDSEYSQQNQPALLIQADDEGFLFLDIYLPAGDAAFVTNEENATSAANDNSIPPDAESESKPLELTNTEAGRRSGKGGISLNGADNIVVDVLAEDSQNAVFTKIDSRFLITLRGLTRNKDDKSYKGFAVLSKTKAVFLTFEPTGSTIELTELVFVDVKPKKKRMPGAN